LSSKLLDKCCTAKDINLNHIVDYSQANQELRSIIITNKGYLANLTIKDYVLEDPKKALLRLFLLPGMKPSIARQFDRLIRGIYRSLEFENLSIPEFFAYKEPSKRLANALLSALENGDYAYDSIGSFLHGGDLALERLGRIPNMGRKSKKEFVDMIEEERNFISNSLTKPEQLPPIDEFLKNILSERELKILYRRIGEDNQKGETLDKIGVYFNVTRERIRQVESKALTKLRSAPYFQVLEQYVDEYYDQIVLAVMSEKNFIYRGQMSDIRCLSK